MARRGMLPGCLGMAMVAVWLGSPSSAQQPPATWQTETNSRAPAVAAPSASDMRPTPPAPELPNTTIVPRSPSDQKPSVGGVGQVTLTALLTEDGQGIEQGLVWRVFHSKPGLDGKPRIISTHREASPVLRLEPGEYIVNVAYGRAHLTRRVTISKDRGSQERFVLNAGGLRLTSALVNGEHLNERAVTYDIFSDERDQYGQRQLVMSGVKPGIVIRLNAGIYYVVSTYGDANAVARADVTVEAGKLTEAQLSHAAAKVTFKLVARPGGDAIADTQWSLATPQGEVVKESIGALPTHIIAPGSYTLSARNAGDVFQRTFTVQSGQTAQIEVVRR